MGDRKMNDFAPVTDAAYMYAEDANGNQVKIKKSDVLSMLSVQIDIHIPSKATKKIYLQSRIYAVIDSNTGSSAILDLSWDKRYVSVIYQTGNNNYSIGGSSLYSFHKEDNGNYINVTNNSNMDVVMSLSI